MGDQRSLTDQLQDLIGIANKHGLYDAADYITRAISGKGDNKSVRPAQNGCRARENGVACGLRTYAGHLYCPKHQQRFVRHGDPCLKVKPGRKRHAES